MADVGAGPRPAGDDPTSGPTRAGVVALLGRPNSGKSTLLNRLLGEKLAIVTPKPQTTRSRLLGILTRGPAQLLLLDTPGFHESPKALNQALNGMVEEALEDCDVAVLLVDPDAGWDDAHAALRRRAEKRGVPLLVVGTKADASRAAWPPAGADDLEVWRVSARTGEGVEALLDRLVAALPESPHLYPEDELTDRPLRFLAAELIREVAFEELAQEVPYSLAVEVEEFDESRPDGVRIRANLLVERASQKPIVLGRGGSRIKAIGSEARRRIGEMLGGTAHLSLWGTLEPRWSRRPRRLESLGYRGRTGRPPAQRCSGFGWSKRQPASHSERWLPWAGMPPASFSIRARCIRFQVMKVVLRWVNSFSGPPEPSSR